MGEKSDGLAVKLSKLSQTGRRSEPGGISVGVNWQMCSKPQPFGDLENSFGFLPDILGNDGRHGT
jgi:hypothetical protein